MLAIHKTGRNFALFITSFFFVLGLVLVINHEMWCDELQAWNIARDTPTLFQLILGIKYDGHPAAWYLLLRSLTQVFATPLAMQICHIGIATASCYLLTLYAPFTRFQKLCIVFGYFMFYEYAALSRNYALCILCLFSFCCLFAQRFRHPYRVMIIIIILAQTHAYGTIFAIGCLISLTIEWCLITRVTRPLSVSAYVGAWLLGSISIIYAVIQYLTPPANLGMFNSWNSKQLASLLINDSATYLGAGYFPIPKLQLHFWNSHLLLNNGEMPATLLWLLGLSMCILVIWKLRQAPASLLLYLSGTAGVLILIFLKQLYATRHYGMLFGILIAALWIAPICTRIQLPVVLDKFSAFGRTCFVWLFTSLCVAQFIGGVFAATIEMRYSFSNSKKAAQFLVDTKLENAEIIGYPDYSTGEIAAWLNRPLYYPGSRRHGTYVIWNTERRDSIHEYDNSPLLETKFLPRDPAKERIIIVTQLLPSAIRDQLELQLIANFSDAIIEFGNFYIYKDISR